MRSLLFWLTVLVVSAVNGDEFDKYGHQQCRDRGFMGACNYNSITVLNRNERCQNLRCATEFSGSGYKFRSIGPAAIGTKCGPKHVCDIMNRCVPDPNNERPGYYECSYT